MNFTNDNEKIEYIFKNYSGKIKAAAKRYLYDDNRIEDVLQETFFDIIKNISKINIENCHEMPPLIGYIVKCKAIDAIRASDRRTDFEAKFRSDNAYEAVHYDDYSFENDDGIISEAMNSLKKDDREIIRLKVIFEMSYKEIADRLNISESTARKRYERAKKRIIKIMEKGAKL